MEPSTLGISSLGTEEEDSSRRTATTAELAAVFDHQQMPLWSDEDVRCLPSNEQWAAMANPHLVTLRICAVAMTKTKPELLEMARKLFARDDEAEWLFEPLVDGIHSAQEMFKAYLQLLDSAEARLLSAASKVAMLEGWECDDQLEAD